MNNALKNTKINLIVTTVVKMQNKNNIALVMAGSTRWIDGAYKGGMAM